MKRVFTKILRGLKYLIERAIDHIGFIPDTSRVDRRPKFKMGTRYIDSAGRRWRYGQRVGNGYRFE